MERGKNKVEWQDMADARLKDSEILFENKRYSAAYYLAGYAVECALKAKIASLIQEGTFPPKANYVRDHVYTHSLEKLIVAAELSTAFDERRKAYPSFGNRWKTVKDWSEESRYDIHSERTAAEMLESVKEVVTCIKQYW